MTALFATQIDIDTSGVAWRAGTRVKVVEVVLDKVAQGWSAETIYFEHPNLLLAQIHAALTYYCENQAEMDESIRSRIGAAADLAAQASEPAFRSRLLELKRRQ